MDVSACGKGVNARASSSGHANAFIAHNKCQPRLAVTFLQQLHGLTHRAALGKLQGVAAQIQQNLPP